MQTARNIAIVVALAALVAFAPGGGEGAGLISQLLSAIFVAAILVFGIRLYRGHQAEIFGLGDRWRLLLYGALATLVLAFAASRRLFDTGAGTLVWFLLVAGASYALFATWRHWRTYA